MLPRRWRLHLCSLLVSTSTLAAPAKDVGSARVRYVGGGAIFLDRGHSDGVVIGSSIDIKSRGRVVGSCTVDAAAGHSARCAFADAKAKVPRVGERVVYPRVSPTTEAPLPPPPPPLDDDVLEDARATILAASMPKVAYTAKRATLPGITNRLDVGVRAQSWAVVGANDSVFVRPAVDVGARGVVPFVPGLYGSVAGRVRSDVIAPDSKRFRAEVPAELLVYEAMVGLQAGRGGITGSLGRFRPAKAPGVSLIDGASLGYVGFGGAVEVGAYGGLIPDLISIAPSADRVGGGAYFGLDSAPLPGLLVLPRARVGFLTSADLQRTRAEAEAQLQVLYNDVIAVGTSVKAALPGDTAVPVLDAARLNVDVMPTRTLRLRCGLRTVGPHDSDLDVGVVSDGSVVGAVRAAHHGDAGVQWLLNDLVVVGGSAAFAVDADSGSARALVGPELGLPRLFGDLGGISLGAYEEPGDMWGRSAFVQSSTRPLTELLPQLTWAVRASYFEHQAANGVDDVLSGALREALLMTSVDAPLTPWLSLRGRAQSFFDIVDLDGFGSTPVGLFVDVGLTGSL